MSLENERIDFKIFKNIGDLIIGKEDFNYIISGEDLLKLIENLSLTEAQIEESLKILGDDNLIKLTITSGSISNYPIQLTQKGFKMYAERFIDNYSKIEKEVISAINNEVMTSIDISSKKEIPIAIVDFLLKGYVESGYIECANMAGITFIDDITAKGNRYFKHFLL